MLRYFLSKPQDYIYFKKDQKYYISEGNGLLKQEEQWKIEIVFTKSLTFS